MINFMVSAFFFISDLKHSHFICYRRKNDLFIFRRSVRVDEGLSIKIDFKAFDTEEEIDVVSLYEGTGAAKTLSCEFIDCNSAHVKMLTCLTPVSSFTSSSQV